MHFISIAYFYITFQQFYFHYFLRNSCNNYAKIKSSSIKNSAEKGIIMKKRIIFIALILIIPLLSGCSKKPANNGTNASSQETATNADATPNPVIKPGQTGVLIQNTNVTYFSLQDYKKHTVKAEKGSLVLLLNKNKDSYHVQFAVTELPVLAGNINKETVSFEEADLKNAKDGLVKHANVYKTPNSKKPYISGYSSAVSVEEKEGSFFKCCLPGGDYGYIKENDIEYTVEKADWTVEMLPPE